jgi:hypothetical protein
MATDERLGLKDDTGSGLVPPPPPGVDMAKYAAYKAAKLAAAPVPPGVDMAKFAAYKASKQQEESKTFIGGLKAGLTAQPGEGAGYFIGAALPATIGGVVGGPVGAALGEAARQTAGAIVNPEDTARKSPLDIGGQVMMAGAGEAGGRLAAPYISKGLSAVGRGTKEGLKAIGRKVMAPIIRGTTGVSRTAMDGLLSNSKAVLSKIGATADDIASYGKQIEDMIKTGKSTIDETTKRSLSERAIELEGANQALKETADESFANAVNLGQELQGQIGKVVDRAGEEYRKTLNNILSSSGRYGSDPGAAYPYTIDLKTPMLSSVNSVRSKFGYGLPGRITDEAEVKLFQKFQNRIAELGNASVEDAYYLQRDLQSAIRNNQGKPISAALGELKSKAMSVLDESVPEIRGMNQGWKAAMELEEGLGKIASADNIAKTIQKSFQTGGNLRDTLIVLGNTDEAAGKTIKGILDSLDVYDDAITRGKDISKMTDKVLEAHRIFNIEDASKALDKLATKDETVKKILASVKDKEAVYSRLSNVLEGDNASKALLKILADGGKKKDALIELSKEMPEVADKILDLQSAIYGKEFTPWMREVPQTGMGAGIIGGLGYAAAKVPGMIPLAPLFSPRLMGMAASASQKAIEKVTPEVIESGAGAVGKAAGKMGAGLGVIATEPKAKE